MRKSITLVELIISISLMGVIILAVVSFHVASQRLFPSQGGSNTTLVMDEAVFLLEHISTHTRQASGDITDRGIIRNDAPSDKRRLYIRQINNTPADYSDDVWVAYYIRPTTGNPQDRPKLYFCDNLNSAGVKCDKDNGELLSSRVVNFNFTTNGEDTSLAVNQVRVTNLTLRFDPQAAVDPNDNPQITLSGNYTIFTSLAHSIN